MLKRKEFKMDTVILALGALMLFLYMRLCGNQKRPIKSMLVNSLAGVIGLITAAVVSGIFGVGIAVNYATVLTAAALGVPGVLGVVLIMFVL